MLLVHTASAQDSGYSRNYFSFPVYPGVSNTLSGVLGDLRSNHFHGGIDIRTRQGVGLPVTAAAEGYVSRVAVQRGGYGNVIFVRHPNGMTTVYGHLQKFSGLLGQYVREKQYSGQTFEIDLTPEAGAFPVKKGELIALSGNTGSSQGPHLHFEIRDAKDNYLNPLFFGFKEIRDNIPPRFVSIALNPMELEARVSGTFERKVFKPRARQGSPAMTLDTIRATGLLGLELQAFDRMDGAAFNYGLFCIEVKMDGREVFTYNMEHFPVSIARDYNHLINYRARLEDGERFYKCYNPEGHRFDLYQTDEYRGKLWISDTLTHQVEVRIYDAYENFSELKFVIKGEKKAPATLPAQAGKRPVSLSAAAEGAFLTVRADHYSSVSPQATFYLSGREKPVAAGYSEGESTVFVWDLKAGLPDSARVGEGSLPFYYQAKIAPGADISWETETCRVDFEKGSLFDTLYLFVRQRGNGLSVNEPTQPLKGRIEVAYSPEILPALRDRTHIYRLYRGGRQFVGGEWAADGRIRFRSGELGDFYPLTDTIPPKVRFAECSKARIRAYISDELSGIRAFRAKVNGEWVLMNYEFKQSYLWSEKLNEGTPFEGEVVLEVEDKAGNITVLKASVTEPAAGRKKVRQSK